MEHNEVVLDTLKIYFKEMRKFNMLNADTENEYLSRAQLGDIDARNEIINANQRLIISIAKKFMNRGLPLQDLIQEGNLGLIRAIIDFNIEKGYKFSTYASYWITQKISRSIANNGRVIRIPVHVVEQITKFKRVRASLTNELGYEPSLHQIGAVMKIADSEVEKLYWYAADITSIDTPVEEDGSNDYTLADLLEDEKQEDPLAYCESQDLKRCISTALSTLKPQERTVIRYRFGLETGEPMTLEQIGNKMSLSRERIRQVEDAALRKLRNPIRNRILEDFV